MTDHNYTNCRYLRLPERPDRAIIDAIYKAWDFYGKPENEGVLGSSEAERIYRELYKLAGSPP